MQETRNRENARKAEAEAHERHSVSTQGSAIEEILELTPPYFDEDCSSERFNMIASASVFGPFFLPYQILDFYVESQRLMSKYLLTPY